MNRLDNLKLGRVKKFEGSDRKIKTTLNLSEPTREYLKKTGNMSEAVEHLVWIASKGKSGIKSDQF